MAGLTEFFSGLTTQFSENESAAAAEALGLEVLGEIEDVGDQARDLIRRIQGLRNQFQPDSVAARALPDIRVGDDDAGLEVDQQPQGSGAAIDE